MSQLQAQTLQPERPHVHILDELQGNPTFSMEEFVQYFGYDQKQLLTTIADNIVQDYYFHLSKDGRTCQITRRADSRDLCVVILDEKSVQETEQ